MVRLTSKEYNNNKEHLGIARNNKYKYKQPLLTKSQGTGL